MDQQKRINITRIINIKSNIKAIGWMMIFVFGLILLYSIFNLAEGALVLIYKPMESFPDELFANEFNDTVNLVLNVYLIALLISTFMVVSGISILDYRRWALYTFHLTSTILVIGIFILLAYYVLEFIDKSEYQHPIPMTESEQRLKNSSLKLQMISVGTIGLFIAWVVTRMNLLLTRKEYRKQFK